MGTFRGRKGLTLIEVMITLGILGIVMTMAFSLFSSGTRTFRKGEKRSEVQFDARMAASAITRQLRNAKTVNIFAGAPGAFDLDKKYIYEEDGAIVLSLGGIETHVLGGTAGQSQLALAFGKRGAGERLYFHINDTGSENFDMDSEVLVQNIESAGISGTEDGKSICFGPLTISEAVTVDTASIDLEDLNGPLDQIDTNLMVLPTAGLNGTEILWESSNEAVISTAAGTLGVVTRPAIGQPEVPVVLTAKVSRNGTQKTRAFNITVLPRTALAIAASPAPPAGKEKTYYEYTFQATGGDDSAYTFSYSGALPASLQFFSDGLLKGTPKQGEAGSYGLTVNVVDYAGTTVSQSFTLVINPS